MAPPLPQQSYAKLCRALPTSGGASQKMIGILLDCGGREGDERRGGEGGHTTGDSLSNGPLGALAGVSLQAQGLQAGGLVLRGQGSKHVLQPISADLLSEPLGEHTPAVLAAIL